MKYYICAGCKNSRPYYDFTILNRVSENFQLPTLLKRLRIEWHDLILFCNKCGTVFESSTRTILTEAEEEECDKIFWNL